MLRLNKLRIFLILVLVIGLIVSGCRASEESGEVVGGDTTDHTEVIEIGYGHGFMPETPHHRSAIKFKEEVEEATGGRVKVNLFPAGQLGSAREMFEGLQMGTQEIALVPTARIS
ncbi:MAG: hypothetical protein WCY46_02485, partial [Tissierellaceae bacterium]